MLRAQPRFGNQRLRQRWTAAALTIIMAGATLLFMREVLPPPPAPGPAFTVTSTSPPVVEGAAAAPTREEEAVVPPSEPTVAFSPNEPTVAPSVGEPTAAPSVSEPTTVASSPSKPTVVPSPSEKTATNEALLPRPSIEPAEESQTQLVISITSQEPVPSIDRPSEASPPATPLESPSPPRAPAASINLDAERPHSELELRAVGNVIAKYQQVYNRLDPNGAAAIWPGVDTQALRRSFAQLERQNLSFDQCSIVLGESTATAHCPGLLEYVPRVGNNRLRTQRHVWVIELLRQDEGWHIIKVAVK